MKKDINTHRVVTFLNRPEIDFLDKMEKDMMFSTGKHISRSQILQDMAELLAKTRINAAGVKDNLELKQRIQNAFGRIEQEQDKAGSK